MFNDDSIKLSDEQRKEYENRSMIRLDGLLKMVNDLLDISRMELKTIRKEIKETNIPEIIKSVLELFQLDIKNKSLEVNFHVDKNIHTIDADNDELIRLFTNLISNAIKYNNDLGKININVKSSGNFVLTEIKDSGIGLKPEEKTKLFSEFFRAKNEKTKNIGGTGLGLSIVKRIVDSYSGHIEVESEYEEGTTFRVYLPFKDDDQKK